MPDGREVLRLGHDVPLGHQRHRLMRRQVEPRGALVFHPLRPLQEDEMLQRLLAERDEGQVDPGRIVVGRGR